MNTGSLRDHHIGHWLLTDEGRPVQLLSARGALLFVQTEEGRVYFPIHDIKRKISEEEAMQLTGGRSFQQKLKPKPKKVTRICRVVRTDMEGNEEVFRNIREAARASELAASTVGDICHGKPTRVTKYTFRFADE